MLCTQFVFVLTFKKIVYTTCQDIVNCNSMNNLLSYYGLIDARMRASDKDLPVFIDKHTVKEMLPK